MDFTNPEVIQKIEEDTLKHVPVCTCGKCIVRRLRTSLFPNFPYGKNIGSVYSKDFAWNDPLKLPSVYNKSKHSGFENTYKEHLPTALISTNKFDYRPFKINPQPIKEQKLIIDSAPFSGSSTYNSTYLNWGSAGIPKNEKPQFHDIKIPLRGRSNYKESYFLYDPAFYNKGRAINFSKDTLEFYGKLKPDTTMKLSYRPVDFSDKHYFNNDKIKRFEIEKCQLVPAPFPKSNFVSTYSTGYVDMNEKKCQLREFLNEKNIKYLEI
jgi:hypothetical protein